MDLNKPIKIDFKNIKLTKLDLGLSGKIKVSEKDKNILAVFGTCLILLGGWQFMISPQYENVKRIQAEMVQNKAKADSLLDKYKHLDSIKSKIEENKKILASLDNVFPKNLYTEQVLNYVDGIANSSDVRMAAGISITDPAQFTPAPGQAAALNFYKRDITASFTGSYSRIMDLISKLQSSKIKMLINSVSLSPASDGKITANLAMSIFTYNANGLIQPTNKTLNSQINIDGLSNGNFNMGSGIANSGSGNSTSGDEKKKSIISQSGIKAGNPPSNQWSGTPVASNGINASLSNSTNANSNNHTNSTVVPVNNQNNGGNNIVSPVANSSAGNEINISGAQGNSSSLPQKNTAAAVSNGKSAVNENKNMELNHVDFYTIANSYYDDQASVIVGKNSAAYAEISSKQNSNQDVTVTLKKENGKYYFRYSVGHSTYPSNSTFSEFKPTSTKNIVLNVISSKRLKVTDLAGVRFNIRNSTGLPIYVVIANDDSKNPRIKLGNVNGTVKLINRTITGRD